MPIGDELWPEAISYSVTSKGSSKCCASNVGVASAKGRYSVRRLIEKYDGDCPRRDSLQLHDRCDLICPELPKVL